MTFLSRLKKISYSSLISLTTLVTSLTLTEAATATWNYVNCIGVQNDEGPLKITSKATWYYVYGDWGNPNLLSGTLGDGGWMNYFRLSKTDTIDVKSQCAKYLPSNSTIYPMVQFTSISYQWPIIDKSKPLYYLNNNQYFGNAFPVPNPKNSTSFINYTNLLTLAEAAYLVGGAVGLTQYQGLLNTGIISNERGYENLKANYTLIGSLNEVGSSKATSVGLLSNDGKYIIISFRGTSSLLDVKTDINLMMQNINNGELISDYISQGYKFYRILKQKYPNATVILTGHSLGGYIASIIAMKSGEIARVFSSPANYIINNKNLFANVANTMDPVVNLSGRHVSSEIFFPGTSDLLANHKLKTLIEAIRAETRPTNVYLNPDAILFNSKLDPITLQVNYQGPFPAP